MTNDARRQPPAGIITVLNTPFSHDGTIDTEGLKRHVRYALAAGVHGFFVPGLAGEASKLTLDERKHVVDTVLDASAGRVPVLGGATASDRMERQAAARWLIDRGCDGIVAFIPFNTEAQYEDEVHALADLDPPYLMVQDWAPDGTGLPLNLIVQLFERVPAFTSLKIEVIPAGPKYTQVREATAGRLHLAGGWAAMQFIEALDRGVDAFMPTALHHTYVSAYCLYQQGERAAAAALFNRALPVLAFANQHLDISIHFFKRLLHAQGVYATDRVREPILPFDAHHERLAAELVRLATALEDAALQE